MADTNSWLSIFFNHASISNAPFLEALAYNMEDVVIIEELELQIYAQDFRHMPVFSHRPHGDSQGHSVGDLLHSDEATDIRRQGRGLEWCCPIPGLGAADVNVEVSRHIHSELDLGEEVVSHMQ